jgi:hypothetical protein
MDTFLLLCTKLFLKFSTFMVYKKIGLLIMAGQRIKIQFMPSRCLATYDVPLIQGHTHHDTLMVGYLCSEPLSSTSIYR